MQICKGISVNICLFPLFSHSFLTYKTEIVIPRAWVGRIVRLRLGEPNGAHATLGEVVQTKMLKAKKKVCVSKWRMEDWSGNCAHPFLRRKGNQDLMKRGAHGRQTHGCVYGKILPYQDEM